MTQILDFIRKIKSEYPVSEMPFMQMQLERVRASKPYSGLTILQNIPFTRETIIKSEILIEGGATLTVTSPSFMEPEKALVDAFKSSNGNFVSFQDISERQFDIHLDCAAELLSRPRPGIGTVEITGTGTNKYFAAQPDYPVISIDLSVVKNLEGILGTGEAFVRAFKQLTNEDIAGKKFMIFGYGKVGRGMAHYLSAENAIVYIVETNPQFLKQAISNGYKALAACNTAEIEDTVKDMFCVATATGKESVITGNFNAVLFKNRYLANMGGDDEFGAEFTKDEVLCEKRPINFFVEKPTLMRYLDPVFYAHNMGIDILLYAQLNNGLHPFPAFIAEEIVSDWTKIFGETTIFKK